MSLTAYVDHCPLHSGVVDISSDSERLYLEYQIDGEDGSGYTRREVTIDIDSILLVKYERRTAYDHVVGSDVFDVDELTLVTLFGSASEEILRFGTTASIPTVQNHIPTV